MRTILVLSGVTSREEIESFPYRPTHVFVTAGGDPPVAPATVTLSFETADPYAVEAGRFAAAVLDGTPLAVEPEDAVANLRVIERIFDAAGPRPEPR